MDNIEFVSKLISEFKKTQPKKKRQNIDRAIGKLGRLQPLNRLEREAFNELQHFIMNYELG